MRPSLYPILLKGWPAKLKADLSNSTVLPDWITYSGSSLKTRFDSTGKLTYCPNNLLLNTASLSTQNVTTAPINYIVSFTGTGTITLSGTSTAGPLEGTGASDRVYLAFTPTAGTLTLTVSGSVTLAQLEAVTYQTTPSTYKPTTSAAYYGPCFDYDPVTLAPLGVSNWPARTNLVIQSGALATAAWTSLNATKSSDAQTMPDGAASAILLVDTAVNNYHYIRITAETIPIVSAGVYTLSCGFKANAVNVAQIRFYDSSAASNIFAVFNLATLAINTSVVGAATVTGTSLVAGPDGWFRASVTGALNGGFTAAGFGVGANNQTTVPSDGYLGTGANAMYVYGPQLELGSFPTSYIPTAASAVTRAADVLSSTNAAALACKAWIIETGEMQAATAATLLGINTGIALGATAANALTTADGGAQTTGNTATWTGTNRGGIAFDATPRVSIDLNGDTVVTAANTPDTPTALYFGNTNNGASGFLNGHLRKIYGYSTPPDAVLKAKCAAGAPL